MHFDIELSDRATDWLKAQCEQLEIEPSDLVESLCIGTLADALARQHFGTPQRALVTLDDDGRVVRGDALLAHLSCQAVEAVQAWRASMGEIIKEH